MNLIIDFSVLIQAICDASVADRRRFIGMMSAERAVQMVDAIVRRAELLPDAKPVPPDILAKLLEVADPDEYREMAEQNFELRQALTPEALSRVRAERQWLFPNLDPYDKRPNWPGSPRRGKVRTGWRRRKSMV